MYPKKHSPPPCRNGDAVQYYYYFFTTIFIINHDVLIFRSNPRHETILEQSISPEKAACSIDEAFIKEVLDGIIQDPQIGNET